MHSASSISIPMSSMASDGQVFPSSHSEDAENNLTRRSSSPHPLIMNPHSKFFQFWRRIFIFLFLFSFLLQTLFIFLQHVEPDNNCIVDNSSLGAVLFQLLGLTNFIFLYHVIFRFRVAYVDPESRVLVYDRKKVALNYLRGYFIMDLFFVLPLTQYILGSIRDMSSWSSGLFEVVYFLLYLAVLCRLLSMFADQSTNAFLFESWSSKFFTNLLAFFLFSHVVGSFWYYFALNRVDRCLRNACGQPWCSNYISCLPVYENGIFKDDLTLWKNNNNATACFGPDGFDYGIFVPAVSLLKKSNLSVRYMYSLFWGFQQISTLAGNQTPSFFVVEVLFTMFITATGLLLFSLLIGNMQSFFQALGRRSLEKSIRGLDVEQWMSHRRLPEELKCQIRESEQYNWLATRGVNELTLLENFSEDLQRDVRRHLFRFVEKFPIFANMDERILDAIRERMKQKTYITGSKILVRGGLIDNIVFIVQGKLESIGEDNILVHLSEGDVCGEELVTLCLEHSSLNRDEGRTRIPAQKFLCKRMVRCLTNVEAFTVRATDLEEVFTFYSGFSDWEFSCSKVTFGRDLLM